MKDYRNYRNILEMVQAARKVRIMLNVFEDGKLYTRKQIAAICKANDLPISIIEAGTTSWGPLAGCFTVDRIEHFNVTLHENCYIPTPQTMQKIQKALTTHPYARRCHWSSGWELDNNYQPIPEWHSIKSNFHGIKIATREKIVRGKRYYYRFHIDMLPTLNLNDEDVQRYYDITQTITALKKERKALREKMMY